jgi:putative ABC transport system ATP-binding protein
MAKADEIVAGGVAVAEQNTATIVANADAAAKVGGKTEYVVRAKDVVKIFKMGNEDVHALRGISIDIKRGEYVSIIGPSGSGKSTFFNMIGGLDKPNSGTVFINDVDMAQLDAMELAFLRCHTIGYIFQTFNLIPVMTALENVQLPTIFAGTPSDEGVLRAKELCETVGLGHRLHNKPSQLSGGQQQRVAIARSLANSPTIVLADEPTGNLDEKTGIEIIQLLRRLNQEKGCTVITATHDDKMVRVSDRAIHIRDGSLDRIEEREEIVARLGTIENPKGSH